MTSDQLPHLLAVLWAKSKMGGRPLLLLQHLLDALAVGEIIWDEFLAEGVKGRLDELSAHGGRAFLALLCGLHDVGKATPAFVGQDDELADRARQAGLMPTRRGQRWRHERASAAALIAATDGMWAKEHVDWVWPVLAAHHGWLYAPRNVRPPRASRHGDLHGTDLTWDSLRDELIDRVARAAGFDGIGDAEPLIVPSVSDQMMVAGLVVMADWIASNDTHLRGVDELERVSLDEARRRARHAWQALRLRRGWGQLPVPDPAVDLITSRFDRPKSRDSQKMAVGLAHQMERPGLIIVEAPMGEGKTEAALAAAEVLAARFGADGIFVGMPTQATCDPMYERVRAWSGRVADELPVGLLHGRRRFNKTWRQLERHQPDVRPAQPDEMDEYGTVDDFVGVGVDAEPEDRTMPARWLLGTHRPLLVPLVVGTIDQLLVAATRTKFVSLRHAGLAGKVVIVDEVHAADRYMSQFLHEALLWLARAGVPVILLTATLPPQQRSDLAAAYLRGTTGNHDTTVNLPTEDGYPRATVVWADGDQPHVTIETAAPWRDPTPVAVELLPETRHRDNAEDVAERTVEEIVDGGCVLVVRNTVARACDTYMHTVELTRQRFAHLPDDEQPEVILLHARLSAHDRARRTGRALAALGDDPATHRPKRLVVIATQLAEQSFDVDADLLVTDLTLIDLLLQRAGRLHRHTQTDPRPARLRTPRVIITGVSDLTDDPPWFPPGSEFIYSRYLLLRSAALVRATLEGNGTWTLPGDISPLVAVGYPPHLETDLDEHDRTASSHRAAADLPAGWQDNAAAAHVDWADGERTRRDNARQFLLTPDGWYAHPNLAWRDDWTVHGNDDVTSALVRDGEQAAEVVLVRHDTRGYRSLHGDVPLGVNGEAATNGRRDDVLDGTVRLPARPEITAAASKIKTLEEWRDDPWLRSVKVLILDEEGIGRNLPGFTVRYDPQVGLTVESER